MGEKILIEIITAIIGAVAVIVAAIIGTRAVRVKKLSEIRNNLEQQTANINGDDNNVEQSTQGSNCSQSATIKGTNNFIKQYKK